MEEEDKSTKDNFKYSMCYIPLVAIIFFFTEKDRTEEFNKHVKYGIFLLLAYIILMFFLWWAFWWLLALVYVWISVFLWYKAYNWHHIELELFDTLEKSVKEKMNEKKNNDKNDTDSDNTKTEL